MRDVRTGECLWSEWTGFGMSARQGSVFYTLEHVDVDNEVVRRALASALQRDGSAVSLGDGFRAIESARVVCGYAGSVDGEIDLSVCDELGMTREGDEVDEVLPITWVNFNV